MFKELVQVPGKKGRAGTFCFKLMFYGNKLASYKVATYPNKHTSYFFI